MGIGSLVVGFGLGLENKPLGIGRFSPFNRYGLSLLDLFRVYRP